MADDSRSFLNNDIEWLIFSMLSTNDLRHLCATTVHLRQMIQRYTRGNVLFLPVSVKCRILQFLQPSEMCAIALTCRDLHRFVRLYSPANWGRVAIRIERMREVDKYPCPFSIHLIRRYRPMQEKVIKVSAEQLCSSCADLLSVFASYRNLSLYISNLYYEMQDDFIELLIAVFGKSRNAPVELVFTRILFYDATSLEKWQRMLRTVTDGENRIQSFWMTSCLANSQKFYFPTLLATGNAKCVENYTETGKNGTPNEKNAALAVLEYFSNALEMRCAKRYRIFDYGFQSNDFIQLIECWRNKMQLLEETVAVRLELTINFDAASTRDGHLRTISDFYCAENKSASIAIEGFPNYVTLFLTAIDDFDDWMLQFRLVDVNNNQCC